MHFKHPEILYFLFLLIVPILVHLFQLHVFQKKNISPMFVFKSTFYSNQKSSQIKEIAPHLPITLLLFIILAFAQPFSKRRAK
jgi:hypothetical protein